MSAWIAVSCPASVARRSNGVVLVSTGVISAGWPAEQTQAYCKPCTEPTVVGGDLMDYSYQNNLCVTYRSYLEVNEGATMRKPAAQVPRQVSVLSPSSQLAHRHFCQSVTEFSGEQSECQGYPDHPGWL